MKALTVMNPWAEAIAAGEKAAENRPWATDYRGPLVIHAGKRSLPHEHDLVKRIWPQVPAPMDMTYGAVIAVAELAGCIKRSELRRKLRETPAKGPVLIGRAQLDPLKLMQWTHDSVACLPDEGGWCLMLTSVQRLTYPIPCSGQQKLWNTWTELDTAINLQLGGRNQ